MRTQIVCVTCYLCSDRDSVRYSIECGGVTEKQKPKYVVFFTTLGEEVNCDEN